MTLFGATSCDQQVPEVDFMQFLCTDTGSGSMERAMNGSPTLASIFNQAAQVLDPLPPLMSPQEYLTNNGQVMDPTPVCSEPLFVDMLNMNSSEMSFYPDLMSDNSKCTTDIMQTGNDPFYCNTNSTMATQPDSDECSNFAEKDIDHMQNLVMDEIKREINYACTMLNISQDPHNWSADDTDRWVYWTLKHYKQPIVSLNSFHLDGTSLCMLSEDDFRMRSPAVGATLYTHLDIWRNACFLNDIPTSSPYESSCSYSPSPSSSCNPLIIPETVMSYSQGIPSPAMHSSPRSLSPTGSETSTDSAFSVTSPTSTNRHNGYDSPRCQIQLWQFLREILLDPNTSGQCIRWLDREKGIFKIEDSSTVAKLWGKRKNRPAMNYDKLSRSIRQYYKKGIIKKTQESKRLVYQFCPKYL